MAGQADAVTADQPGDVWAVVLAAGAGLRFGGLKQFWVAAGTRLVDRVVESATATCDSVVVVLPAAVDWDGPAVAAVVDGGATRAESVRRGLAAVPASAAIVVVHDAAHPLASPALFRSVVAAVRGGVDGAVPVLALTETIKRVEAGRVVATVDKAGIHLVQTPQAFRAAALRAAYGGGAEAPEDSVLVEALGGEIAAVAGDPRNVHVTTPAELVMVDQLGREANSG